MDPACKRVNGPPHTHTLHSPLHTLTHRRTRTDEKWLKKVLKKRCMIFLRQYFVTEAQHAGNSSSDICNKNAHKRERERKSEAHTHTHANAHTIPICFFLFPKGGPSNGFPFSVHMSTLLLLLLHWAVSSHCLCLCALHRTRE